MTNPPKRPRGRPRKFRGKADTRENSHFPTQINETVMVMTALLVERHRQKQIPRDRGADSAAEEVGKRFNMHPKKVQRICRMLNDDPAMAALVTLARAMADEHIACNKTLLEIKHFPKRPPA